ncbi:hypothetical protein [Phascolarctobacterium faecium]|uniref:hypothetical protein n=1 Tax=Phascolarctobacterium faecium TaxID=33025 RepID=UPI003AF10285
MQIKKKYIYIALGLWALVTVTYFTLCKIASDQAMLIFNKTMSAQKVLKGSVTLGSIDADIWGRVEFQNLVWLDIDGQPIVHVPQGRFKVRPWDIITRSISTSTIKELELDNALFAVRFNRKMQLDIFEQAQAKRVIDRAEQKEAVLSGNETATELEHIAQEKIIVQERHLGDRHELNLDLENKRLKMRVAFNNCTLTAGYRNRYFVLNEVNAIIDIDTQKKLTIDFVTGKFGGTMVGDGVEIKGNINLAQQIPHYDLHLELYNILPASLGIADIKDTVSITASVTGELPNPVIDGHLDFKELNIPGLHFSKVRGDLHYEDALLKFTNVKGNVFGGTVEAFGDYHLDTKYYNIDALGHELLGSIAARNGKIKCKVELDFKIRSKGDPKTALTYGSFKSGKGSYYIIPFDSISGEFSNQNKHLEFKNVVIETKMGTIKTDAFDIVNGKLHIGEIYLEEPENGQTIKII